MCSFHFHFSFTSMWIAMCYLVLFPWKYIIQRLLSNFFRFFNAFLISMRKINYKFIFLIDIRKALQDVCVWVCVCSDFCALQKEVAKSWEFWSIKSNLFLPYKENSMYIFMKSLYIFFSCISCELTIIQLDSFKLNHKPGRITWKT